MNSRGLFGAATGILLAAPDLVLAFVFAAHWINRGWLSTDMTPHLVSVMLIEFVVIHASMFLIATKESQMLDDDKGRKTALGLAVLYSLFAGGISMAFKSWWPFFIFWGLMINRSMAYLFAPRGMTIARRKLILQGNWIVSFIGYLFLVIVTAAAPIPQLDAARSLTSYGIDAEGGWVTDPEKALVAGMLYFGFLGLLELFGEKFYVKTEYLDQEGKPW
jgi:hypothetical protein